MLLILLKIKFLIKVNISRLAQANLASNSNIISSQSYFNIDKAQFHLILQPLYYTLKRLDDT